MFVKLFKPRWQHSKATVRIKAVHRLSPGNTEHLEVLTKLARQDQNVAVRLAAVEKIAAPDLLSDILNHDSDPDIRRSVAQRICNIILDPGYTLSQQTECLTFLQDENMLAHIALNSGSIDIQQQALQKISDQHCLISLTINGNCTQVRQKAAEKLQLPELLEQASKAIKGRDKTVYRIIRNKQQQILEQSRIEENARIQRDELLNSLEQLSQTQFFPLYSAKLEALSRQWSRIDGSPDESTQQRYSDVTTQCQHVIEAEEQRDAAQQQDKQKSLIEEQQQVELLQKLSETTTRCATLITGDHFCKADLDAEQHCWDSIEQQRHNSNDNPANTKKFNQLKQRFTAYQAAARQCLLLSPEVSALLSEPLDDETKSSLQQYLDKINLSIQQINWPTDLKKPARLQPLFQKQHEIQNQLQQLSLKRQHDSEDLSDRLNQFEQQVEAGHIKIAGQLAQQLEASMSCKIESSPKHLQHRYKALTARLTELNDRQCSAINEKKEQLCEQMEALIDNPTEPPLLAKKINQLQQQWKQLDSSDSLHSHTIWQRFKKASDQAYAPCQTHFREQKQQRENNLSKRTQLVSELRSYMDQVDWQEPDWILIEKLSRTVKQEWKEYAPVDRTPGRQVQIDFNALLKELDAKISEHRNQVADEKRAILAEATELSTTEDNTNAANLIKALQKRWKEAGNTFHSVERELWPEFRQACNLVFDKLNNEKQTQKITPEVSNENHQHNETLLRKIELCDHLENLIQNGTLDQLALDAVQSMWEQTDRTAPYFEPLINSRYEMLLEFISGRIEIEQLLKVTETALRQLCIRLEILLGQESPEKDQSLRMEYQMDRLQKALEQREKSADANELKNLELEWQCHPFTLQHEALQIRFYSNLQQAK